MLVRDKLRTIYNDRKKRHIGGLTFVRERATRLLFERVLQLHRNSAFLNNLHGRNRCRRRLSFLPFLLSVPL